MTDISTEGQSQRVSYDDLDQALKDVDSETSAAEAHGVIAGVLCVSSDDQASAKWVPLLLADAAQMDAEAAKKLSLLLLYLHQSTQNSLKTNDYSFDLLMPDDDLPVDVRIEALADWCRGCLLGMSVQGPAGKESLAEQQKEFVEDLIEISNVQVGQESENQAESYLLELHEFVRIGVQAIFDENQPKTNQSKMSSK